jgi:parallel beta-helix repeat protein
VCVNSDGSGGCYSSIQAAIDAAPAGATISVAPGTYAGAKGANQVALIQKTISLQGTDPISTVIDASGLNQGIVIENADGVTVSGFTIQNAWLEGILLDGASHATVAHSVLRNNDSNPNFVPGDPQRAKCPGAFPFDQDDCGEALHLRGTSFSTVDSNTVEGNIGGILLTDETGPTHDNIITGNTVRNNKRDCGITLASHPAGFGPDHKPLPGHGIYANRVEKNTVKGNGSAGVGIFTPTPGTAAHDNIVTGNTLIDNGLPGVALHSHAPGQNLNGNTITANVISGNGSDDDAGTPASGIVIFSDASHHAAPITGTTVSGNTIDKENLPLYLALNSGTTIAGTLANDTGGAVENYSIIGDGSSYTFTATFTGLDPTAVAGVTVYGSNGFPRGRAGLAGGTATFSLATETGATYDVQLNSYQPHSQASYILTVTAGS